MSRSSGEGGSEIRNRVELLSIRQKIVHEGSMELVLIFSPEESNLTQVWIPASMAGLTAKYLAKCKDVQALCFESNSRLNRIESNAF
jgi:hypothetical protein